MIIMRPIKTDKQREKERVKKERKAKREADRKKWQPVFVLYRRIDDYDNNTVSHCWFQHIERKGRWVKSDGIPDFWWFTYRVPE